ncbi:competence type IV pilus minor pilin ComGF [Enterococcus nangangensis]|uniref:competence type IV pilus minor pilin ComGF n=1 Tax=Enterococcus nangangensis TaxID=2559926 RepID=UPI0010F6624A
MISKKFKSFTLIEALVSLILLGLVCLSFQTGVQQLQQVEKRSSASQIADFHTFLLLLAKETADFHYVSTISTGESISYTAATGQMSINFYPSGQLIRKTLNSGHHPLLMRVKSFRATPTNNGHEIEVTFLNEETYLGYLPHPTP